MNDPYADTAKCVQRLLREYEKHESLIVAVDFDDTCFPYHGTDHTHARVFELLRECQRRAFHIVLFTASAPERFEEMKTYMAERGITVHSVNVNPIELPFGRHGKIYYNILLDDRAGLGQACDTLEQLLNDIRHHAYPGEDRDDYQARLYR